MAAGLKSGIKRRSLRAGATQGIHLGMRPAEKFMRALRENFAVFHEHRADQRIGMRPAPAFERDVERAAHKTDVLKTYFLHSVLAMRSRMPLTNLDESSSP